MVNEADLLRREFDRLLSDVTKVNIDDVKRQSEVIR